MGSGPLNPQLTTPPLRPPQTPRSHHGRTRLCQGEGGRAPRHLWDEQGRPVRPCEAAVRPELRRLRREVPHGVRRQEEGHGDPQPQMETSESHGTFKIPKLKKVNKFKMMGDERPRTSKRRPKNEENNNINM